MINNRNSNKNESNNKKPKIISKSLNFINLNRISIILGILTGMLSIIGIWRIDFSITKNQEMYNIVHDSEDSKNYSKIVSDYSQVVDKYINIIQDNTNNGSNTELKEVEKQIDILTNDISNINDKIKKIESSIKHNNNHDIISSLITGICTIIAALIAGTVAIKVAKIKSK